MYYLKKIYNVHSCKTMHIFKTIDDDLCVFNVICVIELIW